MPFIEQMIYGGESGGARERRMLTLSPGIGKELAAEVRQICEGWGGMPVTGLTHPALISMPLRRTASSLRGNLFAIIRVSAGLEPVFHAVVINEADFAAYGHNPYGVERAVTWMDTWRPGLALDKVELDLVPDALVCEPPPSAKDLVLICESLRHILMKGPLRLPLAQPQPESERALALIIASLPSPLRRELRFASFAGSEANAYTLVAMVTPDCPFNRWQRLLLAEVPAIVPAEVENYVKAAGTRVAEGDLPGLCRLGRDQVTVPGPAAATSAAPQHPTTSAVPSRRRTTQAATTRTPTPKPASRAKPKAKPAPQAKAKPAPQAKTKPEPTPKAPSQPQAAAAPAPSPAPAPQPRTSRLVRTRRPAGAAAARHSRRPRWVVPTAVGGILVAAFVWWGLPALDNLATDGWSGFGAKDEDDQQRPTALLEVVDVGMVYEGQLRRIVQAGMSGSGEDERHRRKAMVQLQADAAGPLLAQIGLFAELAADGIQQASRPDRELARLKSLDEQGARLVQEIPRLELAWHSLDSGADWQDLPRLSDRAVAARRDSVARRASDKLVAAARDLGTEDAAGRLETSRHLVAGMYELVGLLHADAWSRNWTDRLEAAAERVQPHASDASRAYRNLAFTLVRLKRAERTARARSVAYGAEFADGAWPASEVSDVLPDLKEQAGRFGSGDAPTLVTSTLELYNELARAETLAGRAAKGDVLDRLAANPAARFDPGIYGDFLERIRYEAACRALPAEADTVDLPSHLYAVEQSPAVKRFHALSLRDTGAGAWQEEAQNQSLPFLARWAERRGESARRAAAARAEAFAASWEECRRLTLLVDQQAAAGTDWTQAWLDLHRGLNAILSDHVDDLGMDLERAAQMGQARTTLAALKAPRPLHLHAVTVRLPADSLTAATEVVIEITADDQTVPWRSAAFTVGPAAPAGSGWVGTQSLDWRRSQGTGDLLTARVLTVPEGRELARVTYPSLQDQVGPAAMARPRGEGGTLAFQVDPVWWRSLRLPHLE